MSSVVVRTLLRSPKRLQIRTELFLAQGLGASGRTEALPALESAVLYARRLRVRGRPVWIESVDKPAYLRPRGGSEVGMKRFCSERNHRRRALARARRCPTCRKGACGYGSPREGLAACLGCGELIGYYSCAPGYCVACAHDPCWVSVATAVHA